MGLAVRDQCTFKALDNVIDPCFFITYIVLLVKDSAVAPIKALGTGLDTVIPGCHRIERYFLTPKYTYAVYIKPP